MDHINRVLATTANSHKFSLSIHMALIIGKNTINHYYNKTDHSKTYHIAMSKYSIRYLCTKHFPSLHSHHFCQYFTPSTSSHISRVRVGKNLGWRPPSTSSTRSTFICLGMSQQWWQVYCRGFCGLSMCFVPFNLFGNLLRLWQSISFSDSSHNIFDNLPDLAPVLSDVQDELDRYLSTDTEDVRDACLMVAW